MRNLVSIFDRSPV